MFASSRNSMPPYGILGTGTKEYPHASPFHPQTQHGGWDLKNQIGDTIKRFAKKRDAIKGGVLERAVKRGSVRIHNKNGQIEEERTFPRMADPRRYPG